MSNKKITRRDFVQAGISRFALATLPTSVWAITTPGDGLVTEWIEVPTGKEKMPAYLARPKGKGPFPTILVIQEIFGVHEHIQDVCRRLAKEGYLAVAPSLYFRQGDATKVTDIPKLISEIVSKVPQYQVILDLDAVLEVLKKNPAADQSRVAITGFCWGGNVTWMYAAHNPRLKAGVAWYGRLVGETNAMAHKFPVDIAASLKVPVLGLYGGKDKGIPQESVDAMRARLAQGKSHSEIIVYPDADHAFHADYRPSYHEKSAKDGWQRLLKWFRKYGV